MNHLSNAAAVAEFKSAPPAAYSTTEIAAQIAAQLSEPVKAAASITIEEPPLNIVVDAATTQAFEERILPTGTAVEGKAARASGEATAGSSTGEATSTATAAVTVAASVQINKEFLAALNILN